MEVQPRMMNALIMCGGEGSRLAGVEEKPLVSVDGTPMVRRVLDALTASSVQRITAAVSDQTPETAAYLDGRVQIHNTAGEGYVSDLQRVLTDIEQPVIVVGADLPLITGNLIDQIISVQQELDQTITTVVPAVVKQQLGLSVDERSKDGFVPAGVNVIADGADRRYQSYDVRLAVNVNRLEDLQVARTLAQRIPEQ